MNTTVTIKQINPIVLNILADGTSVHGNMLRITDQLSRDVYRDVNKVLEALGGQWSRKDKAHVFEADIGDVIEEAILTGTYSNTKQDFGFFETPADVVVNRMIPLARMSHGLNLLEPSGGHGAILREVMTAYHLSAFTCYEVQPLKVAKLLKFAGTNPAYRICCADFLSVPAVPEFDRIIMNPPFAKRADIRHIRHAFDFLKPGGRLVAVASAAVSFRNDVFGAAFRGFIERNRGTIDALPEGSFKESGTMVNTVLVTIDKTDKAPPIIAGPIVAETKAIVAGSIKAYLYSPDNCPSNHWNDGNDFCADCGADLN